MRALLQRVSYAKVEIAGMGGVQREIGKGILALVGFKGTDTETELDWMAKKIIQLRIFADEQEKMNLSLRDVKGALLVVSQFTLYAEARKGNRPSFEFSAKPEAAEKLYERFLQILKRNFSGTIACGEFGSNMKVSLLNDGPVTILLEKECPSVNDFSVISHLQCP